MVASKLIRYLKEKDKNGVTVSSWAIETGTAGTATFNDSLREAFKKGQPETDLFWLTKSLF